MSKKLYEDRAAVWASMEELVSAGADTWTAEQSTEYERMETEYRTLSERIGQVERFAALAKPAGSPIDAGRVVTPKDEERTDAYVKAFDAYLRRGWERLNTEQRTILETGGGAVEDRVMSTTTGSEGGYLVPQLVRPQLIEALKAFGGIRSKAEVIETSNGQIINLPGNDETGNVGEIITENSPVTGLDEVFTQVPVNAYIYSSKMVKMPVSLLEDEVVDLASYTTRKLGERIGRAQAAHFVTGTGTGQPQGLVTGRATAKDTVIAAAIAYDNLVDCMHAVDPAYRALTGTGWLFNDKTLGGLRKLKDSQNRPLFEPSMQASDPDRLLGYPVTIDQGFDDDVTGLKVPVAFGNINEGYIVRDVRSVSVLRLNELFAANRQVAFIGFLRTDGRVKNSGAYACIKHT